MLALAGDGQLVCPFVFNRNGKEVKDFRATWAQACEAAGRPGALVHDLRRTAVRELHARGVPEQVAMLISGHKTPSVYRRYNIICEEQVAAALGRLAKPRDDEERGNVVPMR